MVDAMTAVHAELVCLNFLNKLGLKVIKNLMLNSAAHEFFPAHKC